VSGACNQDFQAIYPDKWIAQPQVRRAKLIQNSQCNKWHSQQIDYDTVAVHDLEMIVRGECPRIKTSSFSLPSAINSLHKELVI
jgi:hypothetical protein